MTSRSKMKNLEILQILEKHQILRLLEILIWTREETIGQSFQNQKIDIYSQMTTTRYYYRNMLTKSPRISLMLNQEFHKFWESKNQLSGLKNNNRLSKTKSNKWKKLLKVNQILPFQLKRLLKLQLQNPYHHFRVREQPKRSLEKRKQLKKLL